MGQHDLFLRNSDACELPRSRAQNTGDGKENTNHVRVDDLVIVGRELVQERRPRPARPLLEQVVHLLLERAQLVAAEFGEQDGFGSGRDLALDVQDRLDGAYFVAAAVDQAGDARVGRDADRSRGRVHAKRWWRQCGVEHATWKSDSERKREGSRRTQKWPGGNDD